MKRISMHAAFAAVALAAAAVAAVQGLRLQQAKRLNAEIAGAAQAPAEAAADRWRDAAREVRLARAGALSKAGGFDAAFKSYSGLIELGNLDEVGRHALYNLGTMHLRQALAHGGDAAGGAEALKMSPETAPLVELAKQRLRELLRDAPDDWDARYNLERALRLAPEEQEAVAEESNTPVERRNVMLRGMDPGDLP
ncbi:MAG TPA: MxaK protein [Methylibium sp.]|uniref:MxaK protein n=1 Tax=Methylibium sp. TaxID=2067992 RepID=UPI002DBEB9F7|nr:MxaK protein [Methylibium sp.]HEU4460504.1 MxaK protein [Methylibium sp.]